MVYNELNYKKNGVVLLMDNENMRENENINEEIVETEAVEEVAEEVTATEAIEEDIETETDEDDDTEIFEDVEIAENSVTDEAFETDEEIPVNKKSGKKAVIALSVVAAIVVALVIYCICAVNGVGSKSIVNSDAFFEKKEAMDVKFENPVMSLFDKIVLGSNDTAVVKVNDKVVSSNIFNFYLNYSASSYLEGYVMEKIQTQQIATQEEFIAAVKKTIEDVDWNEVDEKTGLSLKEQVRAETIDTLIVPMMAFISEGEKRGVALDENDKKQVADNLAQLKAQYGNDFAAFLTQNGFKDEATYVEMMETMTLMQKVYADYEADMTKYTSEEELKNYLANDNKVSVKHVLVMPDAEAEDKAAAKAEAKTKAEDVLARAKAGEDFDKLIELYNQDSGQPTEGYTFANDGTMVQAFADAAFALKTDEVSDIVETDYGFHIIKSFDKAPVVDDYINMLRTKAKVRIKKGAYNSAQITTEEIMKALGLE